MSLVPLVRLCCDKQMREDGDLRRCCDCGRVRFNQLPPKPPPLFPRHSWS